MATSTPDQRADAFMKSVAGLLRPLVRALIAQGVTAPALYRLVKRIYVDVAEQDYRLADEPPTDSRISMLTGVHRRDVREFRRGGGGETAETRQKVTTIATVLGHWLASAETTDADGQPLPLPRSAKAGPSFDAMVEAVSRDVRPRTVLDELLRQNLVELDGQDRVCLRSDAFLGPADLEQKIFFFSENVGDHIAAAVDNLLTDEPAFMERAVFYNRLMPDSVDEIETTARRLGGELLVEVNKMANERQAEDVALPGSTERFRLGVFFYRENAQDRRDEGTDDEAR